MTLAPFYTDPTEIATTELSNAKDWGTNVGDCDWHLFRTDPTEIANKHTHTRLTQSLEVQAHVDWRHLNAYLILI